MLVGDRAGRAGVVRVEHGDPIAAPLRCMREHAAELAAAHDAERRAGRDERRPAWTFAERRARRDERAGFGARSAHFRSADIARAASVWRARKASSFARSAASSWASIATANRAALAAPATPIAKVATGMPRGIWTIE